MSLMLRLRQIAQTRASDDPAHDFSHVARVAAVAERIAQAEGADVDITTAAAWLHELFNHPNNHPDSARSGEICAELADVVLRAENVDATFRERVCQAIDVHGFSRGIIPDALEAKILQDADRLDAVGAIGIARCFATSAVMGTPFYSNDDPFCASRPPDDKQFAVDHFYKKLFLIEERLHTATAKRLAGERIAFMRSFMAQLSKEL